MEDEPRQYGPRDAPAGTRFEIRECIGRGASGVVYRAIDRERGQTVALKTLRAISPEETFRLKREFRSVADLAHPNLIQLLDLVVRDSECYFTMELVEGSDFVSWVRGESATGIRDGTGNRAAAPAPMQPEPVEDPMLARLGQALPQLVSGVAALHACGRLHRDLKPANILIDKAGRLVILDLGLVRDLATDHMLESQAGSVVGTLPYMSPEQAYGLRLTPAADWYSVGVLTYEAITGRLPFDGNPAVQLMTKQTRRPDPPSRWCPGIPPPLDALVHALLDPDPERRPAIADLFDSLHSLPTSLPAEIAPATRPQELALIGRDEELATLHDAFARTLRGEMQAVFIDGSSGAGKTALLVHFLAQVETAHGALVLRSTCMERESLPFKAVDGLVDQLSQFLMAQRESSLAALVPRGAAALVALFPVMARVPWLARAARGDELESDPTELRRRAYTTLRVLLARIAAERPLVLAIENIQWADRDSVGLLRGMARGPDPAEVLVIATYRTEDRGTPMLASLLAAPERRPNLRQIHLGSLDRDSIRTLVRSTVGPDVCDEEIERIEEEADGSPFIAGELARELASGGFRTSSELSAVSLIDRRLSGLTEEERGSLEIIACAKGPISEDVVLSLRSEGAEASESRLRSPIESLAGKLLVRSLAQGSGRAVDTYHERIRASVLRGIEAARRREIHRALACRLEAASDRDPHQLIDQLCSAGEPERAGTHAYAAGVRSLEALAFEQAAELFECAIELGGDAPLASLHARLGEAHANAGNARDAARAYLEAAELLLEVGNDRSSALDLKRRSADQYFRSGALEDGIRVVREVFDAVGLRWYQTRRVAALALLAHRGLAAAQRMLARTASRRRPLDAARVQQMESLWSAGQGFSTFDMIRSAELQSRFARMAHASREPEYVARAESTEAVILDMTGSPGARVRARARHREAERLAERCGNPNVLALVKMNVGVGAYCNHRFREARSYTEQAAQLCREECVGASWELATSNAFRINALLYTGEVKRLRAEIPELISEALDRNDAFAANAYRIGWANTIWLAEDNPERAMLQLERAYAHMGREARMQRTVTAMTRAHIQLYSGRAEAAWQQLREVGPDLRRAPILRVRHFALELDVVRARVALAMAHRDAALLRVANQSQRTVARYDLPAAEPLALLLEAGIRRLGGDDEAALLSLEQASIAFDHLEMALFAAVARFHAGRIQGVPGRALQGRAEAWMVQEGVAQPDRLAEMFAPGLSPRPTPGPRALPQS